MIYLFDSNRQFAIYSSEVMSAINRFFNAAWKVPDVVKKIHLRLIDEQNREVMHVYYKDEMVQVDYGTSYTHLYHLGQKLDIKVLLSDCCYMFDLLPQSTVSISESYV